MTDYTELLDAETWAFIDRTNSFYPVDAVDRPISEQREFYDEMCRAFHAGMPEGVTSGTGDIDGVRCRVYRRDNPDDSAAVLYLHGGGFILGGLESHDDVCAEICARTGFDVISADYRLCPEHTHPAAFDDSMTVFRFLQTRPKPVVLCGDSAGGTLAASVAQATRKSEKPAIGQVLIYPSLGGDKTKGSYVTHAEAPMLTVRDMDYYRDIRAGGLDVDQDATFAPLADTDFTSLPPTVIITAECDPLSSDGETYRDALLNAGGKAHWIEEPGLIHSFMRGRKSVARAAAAFDHVTDAVGTLGRQEWPY